MRRFQRRVFGLTLSVLRDRSAAEEAAQETFVRAWRHASAYDPRRGTVAAWLLTIARNVSINMLPARRFDPIDPEVLLALEAKRPHKDGAEAQVVASELLREPLAQLPGDQRRALVLAAFYGFTAREISELDGVPLGTVKTRIRSAMLKLRSQLRVSPMTAEMGCEQVRELAPELALGIAEGEERDAALRHLTGCAECRQLISELSSVGDELLLLAPAHEPPLGFESRVLARLAEPPARRRFHPVTPRRRWLAVAAAAVLAASLGAGSVFLATTGDRRLADSYQAVLSQGQGSFFAAAPLGGPQGRVGTVFGYQGHPSWVMVTLQPPLPEANRFQVQVVTRDGRYLPVGAAVLGGDNGTWGGQLPVDLSAVHELRFLGSDGRTAFAATFNTTNPWK